jgi:prepilin-type N-terminal cleavage/methylation domain-containing protein
MTKSSNSSDAFTIIEMMVVITVIAILLAIGIGTLPRIVSGYGFESAVSEVDAVIHRARNFALQRQSRSAVCLNPGENTICAIGEKCVGLWHFEDADSRAAAGAFGLRGTGYNTFVTQGRFGSAREFGTEAKLNVRDSFIECGNSPTFTPPTGIVISAWIFPGDFGGDFFKSLVGAQKSAERRQSQIRKEDEITLKEKYLNEYRFAIVAKGSSYFLRLTQEYALEFGFVPDRDYYPFRTIDHVITPNRWNQVILRYSSAFKKPQDRLKFYVDGIELSIFYIDTSGNWKVKPVAPQPPDEKGLPEKLAEEMLPERLEASFEPLTISSKEESFFGKIDEVCISALIEPELHTLKGARLMGYPQIVHFDAQGHLDSEYHDSPVTVMLTENSAYKPPAEEEEENRFVSRGGGINEPPSLKEMPEKKPPRTAYPSTSLPSTETQVANHRQAAITISTVGTGRVEFFRESR